MIKLYDNGVYLLNGTEIPGRYEMCHFLSRKKRGCKRIRLPMESWTVIILQAIWNACRLNLIN